MLMNTFAENCLVVISLSLALLGLSKLAGDAIDKECANQDTVIERHKKEVEQTYISPSDQLIINWNDKSKQP